MEIALTLERQETDFVQACVRKERWAQKKLYEDHYHKMLGVCYRYATTPDSAKDILHEGFIKVFRNIRKYKPGTSIGAWIHRIMVNTAIDYYRKDARRRTEDLEQVNYYATDTKDAYSTFGEEEIMRAVNTLTPAYKMVFNLYVVEGYSHKEIADRLGINESTSRSNLVKARTKLQELLAHKYAK